jgi:hypothetical protein
MDIGAPDDSDDEEANVGSKPAINTTRGGQTNGVENYQATPSAPSGNGSSQPPRASLDGETIFAIGEDDKFSDDDDEDAELVKGTGK